VEEYEVSLADYIRILWKEKWVVLATFSVAIVAALAISYAQPKQYQTSVTLFLRPPLVLDPSGRVTYASVPTDMYKQLALANDLLQSALNQAYKNNSPFTVTQLRDHVKLEIQQPSSTGTTPAMTSAVTCVTLKATFTWPDRDKVFELANAWANAFVVFYTDFAGDARTSLEQALAKAEEDLAKKQADLNSFLRENPGQMLQEETETLAQIYRATLISLNETKTKLEAAKENLSSLQKALEKEPLYYTLTAFPGQSPMPLWGTEPTTVQVLNETYTNLRYQLALKEGEVASLTVQIDQLQKSLAEVRQNLAQREEELLEWQFKKNQLEQAVSVASSTCQQLMSALQMLAAVETKPVIVVETPIKPEEPVGPSKKLNVAVAGVLGLFLGVLLAFVVHYFQESSKAPHGQEPGQPPQEPRQD
jgi:uncharacterized protein involved in exopolysaccharide biosynthesis